MAKRPGSEPVFWRYWCEMDGCWKDTQDTGLVSILQADGVTVVRFPNPIHPDPPKRTIRGALVLDRKPEFTEEPIDP